MNPKPEAGRQHARAAIMSKLATVLRTDAGVTNIESAIARTSVTTQEISTNFGGVRELMLAMVAELSESMSAPLANGAAGSEFTQVLIAFGERVNDFYAASHLRGLYRIAITESIRHTGLGRDFYEVGPGRLTQRLAEFLQSAQAEGVLRCADPHLLASHFLSLLRAELDDVDALAHEATSTVARGAYVRDVVDLFRHGVNERREPC